MIFRKAKRASLTMSFLAVATFSLPAMSDVLVTFKEIAPKDRFLFTNSSECRISDLVIKIDLSDTTGNLIFDTTETGAGVEVFQPFEALQGTISLLAGAELTDGDNSLTVAVELIEVAETVGFTIDVDDTLPQSELGMIRVAGSEIQGGEVAVSVQGEASIIAEFSNNSTAVVKLPDCDN